MNLTPCKIFTEDPAITYCGEPKGQCICGFNEGDHRPKWCLFKPGDKARALKHIEFMDGTIHYYHEVIEVTKETEAYFNVRQKDYEKI